jgi:hypothetical protein
MGNTGGSKPTLASRNNPYGAGLEHFPERWIPVFRKEMRQTQKTKALLDR